MIFHIFYEAAPFLRVGIDCFEAAAIKGEYFVICKSKCPEQNDRHPRVNYLLMHSVEYDNFISGLKETTKCKLIVFHSFLGSNFRVAKDIFKLPCHPKTSWILYGSEISDSKLSIKKFHGKSTHKIYLKLKPLRILLPLIRLAERTSSYSMKGLLKKIDYLIHFMPEEIQYFKDETGIIKPSLWFTYVMIEDFVGDELLSKKVLKKGNILIGNSGSFTSNHAEAIYLLKEKTIGERKVVVPLSYGNSEYSKYIEAFGKNILGKNFRALMDFMPRLQYNEIMLSCSCVIMNHYRQQALGNILTAAWLGSKVFLNESTSTYRYLKRIGIHVHSIEEIANSSDDSIFDALSDLQVEENRKILIRGFGKKEVINKIKESFIMFQ